MSTNSPVYLLQFGLYNEDRPWIDFDKRENRPPLSWHELGRILDGEVSVERYSPVKFQVKEGHGPPWHSYEVPGTYGLISKDVADLVRRFMSTWFEFLDAIVNERPFSFLRIVKTLNCLDRKRSIIVPFPDDPNSVMEIKKYAFLKERMPDPAIFPIPERPGMLFATGSIKDILEPRDLKGLYFVAIE